MGRASWLSKRGDPPTIGGVRGGVLVAFGIVSLPVHVVEVAVSSILLAMGGRVL